MRNLSKSRTHHVKSRATSKSERIFLELLHSVIDVTRWYWTNAICIDQNNLPEKNIQAQQKADALTTRHHSPVEIPISFKQIWSKSSVLLNNTNTGPDVEYNEDSCLLEKSFPCSKHNNPRTLGLVLLQVWKLYHKCTNNILASSRPLTLQRKEPR